jgi:hypothetical protein
MCRVCGKPCAKRGRYKGGYQCVACGIGEHQKAARQINARRGEYYEKWVVGMAAAVERARAMIDAYQEPTDSTSGK